MKKRVMCKVAAAALGFALVAGMSTAGASQGHIGTVMFRDAGFGGQNAAVECGQTVLNLGTQWGNFNFNDAMTSVKTYRTCICIYFSDADLGGPEFGLNQNTAISNVGTNWNDRISSVEC